MGKAIISCVAENNKEYFIKTRNLVKSIRRLGGTLANDHIIINFVDAVEPGFKKTLEQYNCQVRIVPRFDKRSPHCNKIRMLDLNRNFDILIGLDADTVVVKDFSAFLDSGCFAAKVTDGNQLTMEQWKKLFNYFNLPFPTQFLMTHSSYVPVIPYFNSGVLIIPSKYIPLIKKKWQFYALKLLNSFDRLGNLKSKKFFTDQLSLSLTLAATNIPVRPLPLEMNFPTQCPIHPSFSPDNIEPYILHYHHKYTPAGFLQNCNYNKPNQAIIRVNRILKE